MVVVLLLVLPVFQPVPLMKVPMKFTRSPSGTRPLLGLLLCGLLLSTSVQADEATLTVTLKDVRGTLGNLRASLYREPETFRKEDRAFKVISIPATAGDAKMVFADLPPGRYAVMAYHDENGDDKLNLRFGMFPLEGYGLSNNPTVIGPPKFAESAFEVSSPETQIDIKLAY
jgi:uncharacterized protein (DUF2141 family)